MTLFNEEGVEKISTRHIAQSMGISVGNLHYHYANKHEVILKLQAGFIEKSDALALKLVELAPSAASFQLIIAETFSLIHDYRFLFNERLFLSRRIHAIEVMFREMIEKRREEFLVQVEWLKSQGLIRTDLPNEQYDFLFDQIVMLYNSWPSHISLLAKGKKSTKRQINDFVKIIGAIWIPYFTNRGLSMFAGSEGQ